MTLPPCAEYSRLTSLKIVCAYPVIADVNFRTVANGLCRLEIGEVYDQASISGNCVCNQETSNLCWQKATLKFLTMPLCFLKWPVSRISETLIFLIKGAHSNLSFGLEQSTAVSFIMWCQHELDLITCTFSYTSTFTFIFKRSVILLAYNDKLCTGRQHWRSEDSLRLQGVPVAVPNLTYLRPGSLPSGSHISFQSTNQLRSLICNTSEYLLQLENLQELEFLHCGDLETRQLNDLGFGALAELSIKNLLVSTVPHEEFVLLQPFEFLHR